MVIRLYRARLRCEISTKRQESWAKLQRIIETAKENKEKIEIVNEAGKNVGKMSCEKEKKL